VEGFLMPTRTPLGDLIEIRMRELGLHAEALGFRLGCYRNPLKAAGRVHALIDGHITTEKSRRALARLPEALEVRPEVVERAVAATEEFFAESRRQAEEERRIAQEKDEAEWRSRFTPHAVIHTERAMPSSITMCGFSGGIERWLIIRFDTREPPVSYIRQALAALPEKLNHAADGRKYVTFFGRALGFIVNYSPDDAVRCDLDGRPLEVLPKAYRRGEVTLSLGGKAVSPTVMSRILETAR
jgi:hypothetical protein